MSCRAVISTVARPPNVEWACAAGAWGNPAKDGGHDEGTRGIAIPASGFAAYNDAEQVTAIEVSEGGKLLFQRSGRALPLVPPDLSEPHKQMWEITDNGVCVLPERDFHGDTYPKRPEYRGAAAIS